MFRPRHDLEGSRTEPPWIAHILQDAPAQGEDRAVVICSLSTCVCYGENTRSAVSGRLIHISPLLPEVSFRNCQPPWIPRGPPSMKPHDVPPPKHGYPCQPQTQAASWDPIPGRGARIARCPGRARIARCPRERALDFWSHSPQESRDF